MSDKLFRVEAKIKNARLIQARESLGLCTLSAAARRIGIRESELCAFECLRQSAFRRDGRLRPAARKIATFYDLSPAYLWPDDLGMIRKTKVSVDLSAPDVERLLIGREAPVPDGRLLAIDALSILKDSMDGILTRTERDVILARFGREETFSEIGARYALSGERIRTIESQAIGKLRRAFDWDKWKAESLLEAMHAGVLS